MCWATRLKPVLLVAEEDIPVKKILRDTMEPYYHPTLKYEIGKEYYTFMESPYRPIGFHQFMQIGYGFHSYHNMCTFTIEQGSTLCVRFNGHTVCVYPNKNILIADCVITKGSTYYLNEFHEYVSNCIKVLSYEDPSSLKSIYKQLKTSTV